MKTESKSPSKTALILRDTYELYAKMLALENISVIFDEAINAPAQFDILNRVLYISPVHSAQAFLIPGLVIHEVGHALFSLLNESEIKIIKKITKLLNIIDDGYQERMMCKKYPNSKKQLFVVFDHFFLKDQTVYNTGNKVIDIVNTLNFNCKGFKHSHFKKYPDYVLDDDLKLLHEAEKINLHSMMDRWEFSKVLADALKKYGELQDEDIELDPSKKSTSSETESEDDLVEDDLVEQILCADENLLNDHHKKIENIMGGQSVCEVPTGQELLDLSTILELYNSDDTSLTDLLNAIEDSTNEVVSSKQKSDFAEAKKIAQRIFTKFNMRVQASNLANTQYKTSGTLDPERAALYQVYDDVFMKTAIEPNQTNHAYSVVLDWSGSMTGSIYPMMLRIIELVYFAEAADVEIDVWLYTTGNNKSPKNKINKNIAYTGSKFIHVLNTKMNSVELALRKKLFWYLVKNKNPSGRSAIFEADHMANIYFSDHYLGGTNIVEGLILGHHVLNKMDADKKTCFLLSDGEDTTKYDLKFNPATQKSDIIFSDQPKIYLNGIDVAVYNSKNTPRQNVTIGIAELYRSIGQRTIGIAWNCTGSGLVPFVDQLITIKSSSQKKIESGEYQFVDNIFIDEIVKNLL